MDRKSAAVRKSHDVQIPLAVFEQRWKQHHLVECARSRIYIMLGTWIFAVVAHVGGAVVFLLFPFVAFLACVAIALNLFSTPKAVQRIATIGTSQVTVDHEALAQWSRDSQMLFALQVVIALSPGLSFLVSEYLGGLWGYVLIPLNLLVCGTQVYATIYRAKDKFQNAILMQKGILIEADRQKIQQST